MIANGARNTIVDQRRELAPTQPGLLCRTMPGVRLIQNSKGEYARTLLWGVSSSRHQCCSLVRPRKPNRGTEMKNSPYLDKPFILNPAVDSRRGRNLRPGLQPQLAGSTRLQACRRDQLAAAQIFSERLA